MYVDDQLSANRRRHDAREQVAGVAIGHDDPVPHEVVRAELGGSSLHGRRVGGLHE
jgi:hypothetical protein